MVIAVACLSIHPGSWVSASYCAFVLAFFEVALFLARIPPKMVRDDHVLLMGGDFLLFAKKEEAVSPGDGGRCGEGCFDGVAPPLYSPFYN